MLGGRQIAWLIFDRLKLTDVEGELLEFVDLMAVELKGDSLWAFQNDWR